MSLKKSQLEKLHKVVRLHLNWFIVSLLGEDAVTAEERAELKNFNKLPKQSLNFVERSFLLGRFKSLVKSKEWRSLNWEQLKDYVFPKLTPVEKLSVQQAKLRAAGNIRKLSSAIESGFFENLSNSTKQAVTEAAVRQIIADEIVLALIEKKQYQELASNLAAKTKTTHGKFWERISRTELHTVKTEGLAQSIINKIDIYKYSNGIDSFVSVVPNQNTCGDCAQHYLDSTGNPLVFPLRELVETGTNANSDHSRKQGLHTHWKTTLPPLHPNCQCSLVYIPPGYSWKDGVLVLSDSNQLQKAIGDSPLSATKNPTGPPQEPKQALPASIPGVKSPSQKSSGVSATAATMSVEDTTPCPFGGGEPCKQNGGNGAKTHKQGGGIMKAHQEALARGAKAKDPEAAKALRQKTIEDAVNWGKKPNPHQVQLNHIKTGNIVDSVPLSAKGEGEDKGGYTEAYRVTIEGNGRALMKPAQVLDDRVLRNEAFTEGAHSVPHGKGAKHEAAAYDVHMMFGLNDHVPPTETRTHLGREMSMQSWQESFVPAMTYFQNHTHGDEPKYESTTHALLSSVPEHKKEEFRNKMSEIATMAIVLNHNDQHLDNIMYNPETHDLRAIDNTTTSANGMEGTKCQIHKDFHQMGMKLKVPDKLMEKFDNTTLGDFKRSGTKLADWQVGQNFLRMKYVSHLQKAEGHLDFEKFRTTLGTVDGELSMPRSGFWDKDKVITQFYEREQKGQLSNQLFESFAKAWLNERLSDTSHPDHEAAKELDSIGVFIPPGSMANPSKVRAEGKHREYEKNIKPGWPEQTLPSSKATSQPSPKETSDVKTAKSTPVSKKEPQEDERTKRPARKMAKSIFISFDNMNRRLTN